MPNGLQIKFIKEALDNPELLSDWENEFISSIADLNPEKQLSEKQNHILNRIQQTILRSQ